MGRSSRTPSLPPTVFPKRTGIDFPGPFLGYEAPKEEEPAILAKSASSRSSLPPVWRLLTRMTQWNGMVFRENFTLQSDQKWCIVQKNLDIGDLLLIKHNSHPLQWKLRKVTEMFPGMDGKLRVVKVKTQTSELV
ncbi:hypothetical protein TNIN_273981 [Trichonephila inaurata madagascariensis]|uniref:DUF5641 domain-containing protein n=1 Tax=Trichonephila inaurata madagascariensis TaxID=2747483 RepID=A0A8X6XC80_9ARAC|nr:hypothetical protein TNIN_273981 [Trichonephila inaurata madagascariensis]